MSATPFYRPQTEEDRARFHVCPKPGHVRRVMVFAYDSCAECNEQLEARLAYARVHPSVIAANEATARAWEAFQAGKHQPDKEARPLEDAWRTAIEAERLTFSAACCEYTKTLTTEGTTAR